MVGVARALTGSVYKVEEGVWRVRVGAGKDPRTGKYRTINRTVRGPRKMANKARDELIADVEAGLHGGARAGSFAEHVKKWQRHNASRLSPTTLRGYDIHLRLYLLPALGAKPLHRVTTEDVDAVITAMAEKGLAANTRAGCLRVVNKCLNQAVDWGALDVNVAARAERPTLRRTPLKPPTPAQVRAVLADIEAKGRFGPDGLLGLRLLAATGMRRGEVCGLRWTDVDLVDKTVHVEGAVVHDKRKLVRRQPKTEASDRVVHLDPTTLRLLEAAKARHEAAAAELGVKRAPAPFLLAADLAGREPWDPNRLSKTWAAAAKRAGIRARLHDLRHAHITELLDAGVDVVNVASRAGHASAKMTLDVYGHAKAETDQQAAKIAGQLLG